MAAMINCLFGRSFDWGPLVIIMEDGLRHASHNSETTVPTAITVGASRGIGGKELITALVAGDDLVARVQIGSGGAIPEDSRTDQRGPDSMSGGPRPPSAPPPLPGSYWGLRNSR